jgi:hypothetical protein
MIVGVEISADPFFRKEREVVYERNSFWRTFSFAGSQDQGHPYNQWKRNSTFHLILRTHPEQEPEMNLAPVNYVLIMALIVGKTTLHQAKLF